MTGTTNLKAGRVVHLTESERRLLIRLPYEERERSEAEVMFIRGKKRLTAECTKVAYKLMNSFPNPEATP